MEIAPELLPMIITILIIQIILQAICLYDIYKSGKNRKHKIKWAIVVVFLGLLGPLTYILIGREERWQEQQ